MAFQDFVYEYRKILIVIGIIVVAFIIYRYFWEKKDITQDLMLKPVRKELDAGKYPERSCLDPNVQKKIADEITKKLQEIDACDCKDACSIKLNKK